VDWALDGPIPWRAEACTRAGTLHLGGTLEEIARSGALSGRTLARHFRRHTGMSFAEWRRRARLLRALGWIAEGRPILEVAMELGYDSPSAFSAMFRRELGAPPSSFRA
jgi:AraC-like DNA-binding protein